MSASPPVALPPVPLSSAALPAGAIAARRRRLGRAMAAAGIDRLLVADQLNFAYLTGRLSREFEKRFRHLLLLVDGDGEARALVPASEAAPLGAAAPEIALEVYQREPLDPAGAAAFIAGRPGGGRLGLEGSGDDRPCLTGGMLQAVLARLPGAATADASPLLARARLIKTPEELALQAEAGRRSLAAWDSILDTIRPGERLAAIGARLAAAFAAAGGDYNFPGHIELRNATDFAAETIAAGEVLWCDFGLTVAGYHADVSRRAVLGAPAPARRDAQAAGAELLALLIDGLRPGRTIAEAMRPMLARRAGCHHGADPPRRFGHGIGLCAAELPSLAAGDETVLEPGMVVTPEPAFTTARGEFVHLEEMVAIGPDGPLPLTQGAALLRRIG
jgi:Xaa-Pro dipeptidase